jgi:hypothetical protein
VLVQLRQLNTNLTPDEAEQTLTTHARAVAAGPSLDVAAGFISAGLDAKLAIGRAMAPRLRPPSDAVIPLVSATASDSAPSRQPAAAGTTAATVVPRQAITDHVRRRLPRPSVRLGPLRHGRVVLRFKNKPSGTEARVVIYGRPKGRGFPVLARRLRTVNDWVRARVSGTVVALSITYVDPLQIEETSVVVSLHREN